MSGKITIFQKNHSGAVRNLAFLLGLGLFLTVHNSMAAPADTQPPMHYSRAALVGADDDVTLQVLGCDDFNKTWRVSSSGELNLPLIGAVHAEGLSEEQLQKEIAEKLKQFVNKPQVTAFVSEFRSGPVVVSGAVQAPGTYQLEGSKTVLNLLVKAGGPKDAGPTISLRRDVRFGEVPLPVARLSADGKYSIAELQREDVESGRSGAGDLTIKPFDVITVSPNIPKRVYIIGEVNRPGMVEIISRDRMPLMVLVAMAGGFTKTAQTKNLRIMENEAAGERSTMKSVNLKTVMAGKEPDVAVGAGDIVVVPRNEVASYLQSLSMSAATAGVGSGMLLLGRF